MKAYYPDYKFEPHHTFNLISWLLNEMYSMFWTAGVKAFIEQDSKSILDFVNLKKVGPLALAVNPLDLLLPQSRQLSQYFKYVWIYLYLGTSE